MQTVDQQFTRPYPWESNQLGPVSNIPEHGSTQPLPGLTSLGFRPTDPASKLGCTGTKGLQLPSDPAVIDGVTAVLSRTMRYRGFGPPMPTIDSAGPPSHAHAEEAAAKVRNHMDLHFQLIGAYLSSSTWVPSGLPGAASGTDLEHPRYNPLQTLRSRRARGQLPQKFLWSITLSEEISDFAWQQNCYHAGAGAGTLPGPIVSSANSTKSHRRGASFNMPATPRRQSARSLGSDSDSPYASAAAISVPASAATSRLVTPPPSGNVSSSPSRSPSSRDMFGSYQNFREKSKLAPPSALLRRLKAKHGDSSSASDESDSASGRPLFSRSSSTAKTSSLNLAAAAPAVLPECGLSAPDSFSASSVSVGVASNRSDSTSLSPDSIDLKLRADDDNDNENQVFPYYGPNQGPQSSAVSAASSPPLEDAAVQSIPTLHVESASNHVSLSAAVSDDSSSEDTDEILVARSKLDDQQQLCRAQDQLEYIISVFRVALQQNQNKNTHAPCPRMAAVCGQKCVELSTRVMPKYLEYLSGVEGEVIDAQEELEAGIGQTMDHLRVTTERMGSAVSTTLNRQLRETAARLDRLDSCTQSKCLYVIAYATLEYFVKVVLRVTWFLVKLFMMLKSAVRFVTGF